MVGVVVDLLAITLANRRRVLYLGRHQLRYGIELISPSITVVGRIRMVATGRVVRQRFVRTTTPTNNATALIHVWHVPNGWDYR